MKTPRVSLPDLNRILVFIGLCGLLISSTLKSLAEPPANPSDVLAAAKTWLSLIDSGRYEASYLAASSVFHDSITEDKWILALKTLRTPMGPVVSRKVIDHTYKPNGIPGLNSACVIITYETSFSITGPETESVTLKWENGKWLGLSYTWGPKSSDATDSDFVPETTTTTSHITPSSQKPAPAPSPQPETPLPQ